MTVIVKIEFECIPFAPNYMSLPKFTLILLSVLHSLIRTFSTFLFFAPDKKPDVYCSCFAQEIVLKKTGFVFSFVNNPLRYFYFVCPFMKQLGLQSTNGQSVSRTILFDIVTMLHLTELFKYFFRMSSLIKNGLLKKR